jgi:hypothetical protein
MESRTQFNKAISVTSSCLLEHKAGYEETAKNAKSGQRSGYSDVTVGGQLSRLKPWSPHLTDRMKKPPAGRPRLPKMRWD